MQLYWKRGSRSGSKSNSLQQQERTPHHLTFSALTSHSPHQQHTHGPFLPPFPPTDPSPSVKDPKGLKSFSLGQSRLPIDKKFSASLAHNPITWIHMYLWHLRTSPNTQEFFAVWPFSSKSWLLFQLFLFPFPFPLQLLDPLGPKSPQIREGLQAPAAICTKGDMYNSAVAPLPNTITITFSLALPNPSLSVYVRHKGTQEKPPR